MTLHEALAAQGITSFDCATVNKRRLVLTATSKELGEMTASECWEGLKNGFLIYREPLKTYHIEAECRLNNAQGKYEMKWFQSVPCVSMTFDAAIVALHRDYVIDIRRIRTMSQDTQ